MTKQNKSKPTKKLAYGYGDMSLTMDMDDKFYPFSVSSESLDGSVLLSMDEARWLYRVLGEALAMSKEN